MGSREPLFGIELEDRWFEEEQMYLQSSGKAISLQPFWPASLIQWMVFWIESSRLSHPGSALTAAALYFLIVATMLIDLVLEGVMIGDEVKMECDVPFYCPDRRGLYIRPTTLIIVPCDSDTGYVSVLLVLSAVAKRQADLAIVAFSDAAA